MKRLVVDCSTGQQQEVELTPAEVTQLQADAQAFDAFALARKASDDERAAAKAALAALLPKADSLSATETKTALAAAIRLLAR